MMSVWKRLKRWEKAFVIVLTLFVLFSIAFYIRDYHWALDEAFKVCSKGELELCQDWRDFANSRIRGIFVTLWLYSMSVSPIIVYRYRKGG
jgi:peptidoglycan/LPS O-acetylase OafA/YrhL